WPGPHPTGRSRSRLQTTAILWSSRSSTTARGSLPPPAGRSFRPSSAWGAASGVGVGLGWAVAHGFLDAMHGQIVPEDTPGGGLTMRIRLPAADGPAEPGGDRW